MDITLTRMALWLSVYSESVHAVVADGCRFDWAAGYPWNDRSSIYPRRHVQNRAFHAQAIFWFSESSLRSRARFSYTACRAGSRAAIAARGMWS